MGMPRAIRSACAVAVVLLATGCFIAVGQQRDSRGYTPPAAFDAQSVDSVAEVPTLARSHPVTLSIPAIDMTTALDSVGLNPDGTVENPFGFDRPSWFAPGPTPGEFGSAVILGHVDSRIGPAIFYRIGELEAGDSIDVTLANGSLATFRVDRATTVPRSAFPNESVYGSRGASTLHLVTSGGEFDIERRTHRSNVIVYATLVSSTAR